MSDFIEKENMGTVLKDVTSQPEDASDSALASKAAKNKEASEAARAKGWTEPAEYDYSKYVAEDATATATVPAVVPEENLPEWAAGAAKYEWNDEFGDIGPANPELEKMLFHNDYINRTGLKLST